MIAFGARTCYLGFRREAAPGIVLTEEPKLAKSAHRLYGIGLLIGGIIAIGTEACIRLS